MNLTELANKYRSDKGTVWAFKHKYTYLYDLIFWPYKGRAINFLELGLAMGGPESLGGKIDRAVDSPSVAMWLEYFSEALIHGFDISDFSHIKHERFRFVRGDSGVEPDLERLAASAKSFDIIIDDASHASFHQQLALRVLWKHVSPGGMYIIEDLHWQSPVFEASMPKVPLTRDFFCDFFERGRYGANMLFSLEALSELVSEVETFSAFPAFNRYTHPTDRRPDDSAKLIVFRKWL